MNLENNCYLNAVLQCLFSTVILNKQIKRIDSSNMNDCPLKQFVKLIHNLGKVSILDPIPLKRCLEKVNTQFCGIFFQDAQELLVYVLDILEEDLRKVISSNGSSDSNMEKETLPTDSFKGVMKTCLVCRVCSHRSPSLNSFI